jgi:hypothetical protein
MAVEARCEPEGDGYRCAVTVSEADSSSHHLVHVSKSDYDRWSRGRTVEELVRDSFRFLLEREAKESILSDFDLSVIKRYFADYNG